MMKVIVIDGINDKKISDVSVEVWDILLDLYGTVLKNDNNWHFKFRGDTIFLAYSEEFESEIINNLSPKSISFYKSEEDWRKEQPCINESNEDTYKQLLHVCTVFAMTTETDSIFMVFDRFIYYFLNNVFLPLNNCGALNSYGILWEPHFVANYVINKAAMVGEIIHKARISAEETNNKTNKDVDANS